MKTSDVINAIKLFSEIEAIDIYLKVGVPICVFILLWKVAPSLIDALKELRLKKMELESRDRSDSEELNNNFLEESNF